MADRNKIIERVRALLAKTVENGCTEDEAMAAAEVASRLMAEYELSRDELASIKTDRYGIRTVDGVISDSRQFHPVWRCCDAIQKFCNVRIWASGKQIKIFGSEHDTEFAKYLVTIIQIAMERELADFLRSPDRPPGVHGRTIRASFLSGMAMRISERLREMSNDHTELLRATETGRALVVVKSQEVERRFQSLGLRLRRVSSKRTVRSRDAFSAGREAGDRVSFGKPVTADRKALT